MATLQAGRLLARRYRLIDQIGAGGMSVIWRARDEVLDRVIALKVLAPSLAADARFRDMVREEARSAAQLIHPHVTSVHDYGETVAPDGQVTAFVVMELLTGEELEWRLTEGPLPWPEAVKVCAEVAEGLAAAHRLGIVHRDVTPANIMMTATGAKVLDFGIATQIGAPDEDEDGGTFGTPAYVAPERLDGAPAQPATDVYSLGVLLYETLTGHPPYPAETWDELSQALATDEPPSLAGVPGLPPLVASTCLRCLARRPADRPTARQVAEVLRDQLLPGDPQAATMLSPTVTLPRVVPAVPPGEVTRPPSRVDGGTPAATTDDTTTGAGAFPPVPTQPEGAPGAVRRRRSPAHGRPARRRGPIVVVAGTAVALALLAWALSELRPSPPPTPQVLPTSAPVPDPVTPSSLGSPSARPSGGPSGATTTAPPRQPRLTTAPASPLPTASTPPTVPPADDFDARLATVVQLIETGTSAGEIRSDVGNDLRNLIRGLSPTAQLDAEVTKLRQKVAQRAGEGAVSAGYARQLDDALVRLTAAQV